jgi:hypothetical protein
MGRILIRFDSLRSRLKGALLLDFAAAADDRCAMNIAILHFSVWVANPRAKWVRLHNLSMVPGAARLLLVNGDATHMSEPPGNLHLKSRFVLRLTVVHALLRSVRQRLS